MKNQYDVWEGGGELSLDEKTFADILKHFLMENFFLLSLNLPIHDDTG